MSARDNCEVIRPLLSVLIDGEETAEEAALVTAHLDDCTRCAAEFAFLRLTHAALSDVTELPPPAALRERIALATYARPTLRQRIAACLRPTPVRLSLGAAVAVGLVAMVAIRVPMTDTGSGPVANGGETVTPRAGSGVEKMPKAAKGGVVNPPSVAEGAASGQRPQGVATERVSPAAGAGNSGEVVAKADVSRNLNAEKSPRSGAGVAKPGIMPRNSTGQAAKPTNPVTMEAHRSETPSDVTPSVTPVPAAPVVEAMRPEAPAIDRPDVDRPNIAPPVENTPPTAPAVVAVVSRAIAPGGRLRLSNIRQPELTGEVNVAISRSVKREDRTGNRSGHDELGQGYGGGGNFVSAPGTL